MVIGTKVFYGLVVPQVQTIGQLGVFIVLGFAFIAGIAAFFAPCPFAVFPSYIAYFLNTQPENHQRVHQDLLHPLKIGVIVSLGIFSFYAALGIIMALALTFIVYALGASSLLILFTILIDRRKKFLMRNLGLYGDRVKKAGGGVLILTGIYLISFYILFGM